MKIALIQTDIIWENPSVNLEMACEKLRHLRGKCDLAILPEMFTTGFSMNARLLSETSDGITISSLREMSRETGVAIAGSFIAADKGEYYNRGFFITPHSCRFYDKKHLFSMSREPDCFSSGDSHLIVNYKGFNIALMICYDLRFPVWCRNVDNGYDLMIFVASWPEPRRTAWTTLLQARAIENSAYVAGVNRIGRDGHNLNYAGDSLIADMKGGIMDKCADFEPDIRIVEISREKLDSFRERFPVWKDADRFRLIND